MMAQGTRRMAIASAIIDVGHHITNNGGDLGNCDIGRQHIFGIDCREKSWPEYEE